MTVVDQTRELERRDDASGAVVGWCGTNIDVDDSKRAAEALRESVQRL